MSVCGLVKSVWRMAVRESCESTTACLSLLIARIHWSSLLEIRCMEEELNWNFIYQKPPLIALLSDVQTLLDRPDCYSVRINHHLLCCFHLYDIEAQKVCSLFIKQFSATNQFCCQHTSFIRSEEYLLYPRDCCTGYGMCTSSICWPFVLPPPIDYYVRAQQWSLGNFHKRKAVADILFVFICVCVHIVQKNVVVLK